MPYIKPRKRKHFEHFAGEAVYFIDSPGDLNYFITKIIVKYAHLAHPHYNRLNSVIGVLESVKQEFYRRIIAPYEEQKSRENGDAY